MAVFRSTIGSLFAGIGGLERGLEAAGLGPVLFQVEINAYCRAVLARHWPETKRHDDIRRVSQANLPRVRVLCGGFPCQDVSGAGLGAGIAEGTRSGLWYEYRRIVDELRPEFVVVENVASGKGRWLCEVRSDLHALGYHTRAYAISAAEVGAPHRRRRIFVVADRDSDRRWPEGEGTERARQSAGRAQPDGRSDDVADADTAGCEGRLGGGVCGTTRRRGKRAEPARRRSDVSDADDGRAGDERGERGEGERERADGASRGRGDVLPDADGDPVRLGPERLPARRTGKLRGEGRAVPADGGARLGGECSPPHRHRFPPLLGDVDGWRDYVAAGGPQPAVRGGAHGLSPGVGDAALTAALAADDAAANEQLAALGNAVVPQCAEPIGRIIRWMMDQPV